jgi:DNA polymerase-3 subunit epsilon
LKPRGYRREDGANGTWRPWYIDVPKALLLAECACLCQTVYGRAMEPLMRRVTAYERFSVRA